MSSRTPTAADLAVHLTGPDGPRSPALLLDFANVLRTLRATLRHVERCVRDGEPDLEFEVADLSIGSANLTATPAGHADWALAETVVRVERETVARLERGEPIDSRLDDAAIRSFRGFCSPINREGVQLDIGGVSLSGDYSIHIRKLLEPEPSEFGAVSGMLEGINIHGDPQLTLYPPVDGVQVQCAFADEDRPEIESALGKHVTVYGELFYRAGRAFPVRVEIADASTMEIHPDDADLPDLLDYWNNPDDSPEIDSVAVIRAMRDEW